MAVSTIYVAKDSYCDSGNPTTNYGSNNILEVASIDAVEKYSFFEFDLSSIPDSATINNVDFVIYVPSGYWQDYVFKSVASQFTESTVNWNNKPSINADWSQTFNITGVGWKEIPVSTTWIKNSLTNDWCGIRSNCDVDPGFYSLDIRSREFSSYKPYLKITYNEFYVKTTGSDSNTGASWAQAWKTINKVATTVADGSTVHIGFGDYTAEPAGNKIAPQNIGASGIYYKPETAETGGGTGTVSVEQNA